MQAQTKSLEVAMPVGLRINKDKTKIMKVKPNSSQTVALAKGSIDEICIKEFTYLELGKCSMYHRWHSTRC